MGAFVAAGDRCIKHGACADMELAAIQWARLATYGLVLVFWLISAISLDHVYKSL
jgi:hypothetical protein